MSLPSERDGGGEGGIICTVMNGKEHGELPGLAGAAQLRSVTSFSCWDVDFVINQTLSLQ